MLFLGKEFSDVVVVTLIFSPLAAFLSQAWSCRFWLGKMRARDVQNLLAFACSLLLKLLVQF